MGGVEMHDFMDGKFSAIRAHRSCPTPLACPDLLSPEGSLSCVQDFGDHPLLSHVYATSPRMESLVLNITLGDKNRIALDVQNDTGITIGDIRNVLLNWYAQL
jgi:hypothetical protein